MNLNEAKANVGKEVVLDESTKPYSNHTSILSNRCQDVKKGTILGIEENKSVLIDVYGGFHMYVYPKHIKLKEQPMQNYKIKVTPETSAEAQEFFFELGYKWLAQEDGYQEPKYTDSRQYIFAYQKNMKLTAPYIGLSQFELHLNQEITLPQLRDLVVLKRNDIGDATHEHIRSGNKYYRGFKDYVFDSVEWVLTDITFPNSLKPINKEMTWQDALCALADGKDIDMRFNGEFEPLINLLEAWLYGKEFRIKPQNIKLNGEHTKEEWLKILGEMG